MCDENGVTLRRYYLWGDKTIPYSSIKGVQRVTMSPSRGRARIWGSANVRLWANLDTKRMRKSIGFILDVGRRVKPYVTPNGSDVFENLLRERAHLGPAGPTIHSPFI